MSRIFYFLILLGMSRLALSQTIHTEGVVFDALTKEPLPGASVQWVGTTQGTTTDTQGRFRMSCVENCRRLLIRSVGYAEQAVDSHSGTLTVSLQPRAEDLQAVVVTASREAQLRTEAPIAIAKLSPTLINDTKPLTINEVINKTPGVVMVNLNNEQHSMSIRQPMTTTAYFLYLEDGIPIRPMGLFNHNALIEQNIFAISSVEVVKGPASSLYGPEAVGGAINFITHRPTAVPTFRVGVQGDQWGYYRLQFGGGAMLTKRLGVYAGGFVSRQRNSWLSNTDYDKIALNLRADYQLTPHTQLVGAMSYNDYDSQMGGSIDSVGFYNRTYQSVADFTYRRVKALRSRLTLTHQWREGAESFITAFHRYNDYAMQPTFAIRWRTGAPTATGEINNTLFHSYGAIAQHSQRFDFLSSKLLIGTTVDFTPTRYSAWSTDLDAVLRPDKRSVERYVFRRERPDLPISSYEADVLNTGLYAQYDLRPLPRLQLTLGARFDRMSFHYDNFLDSTSGSIAYQQWTPKLGLTYDLGRGRGLYANYSRGFAPPGVTSIFRRRTNARPGEDLFYYNLQPAQFDNYELGGWASVLNNRLYLDWAFYHMNGRNEQLNIRQPDNSFDLQSAGRTLHRGLELGLSYKPTTEWLIRIGGAASVHRYVEFTLSNRQTDALRNVDGFQMPNAPRWVSNAEVFYKPRWLKGFRVAAEWQWLTPWYLNQVNTFQYDEKGAFGARGLSVVNLRTGYEWKGLEVFLNVLNLTDELYANNASRGNFATDRTTFTPGAPRTLVWGIQYNVSGKK